MKKQTVKQPHGGLRPRSGRPAPKGRKSPLSVRLTSEVQEFLESILTDKTPQSADAPSRSEFIDTAVRSTESFKSWQLKKNK